MKSFSILVNPISGGGVGPGAVVPVAKLLRDAGAQVEVTHSESPLATIDVINGAVARGDVVVAVGGDGMVSSIAGRVSQLGGVLGLLPAGRGNDFARMLEMSAAPEAVAHTLLAGVETPTDLISLTLPGAEPRLVVGSVYSGVDALASELVDKVRWMPSKLQYPYAALHSLVTYVPCNFTVEVDGDARSYAAATVVVANSGYYGKGMHIAPDASVTDGLLDVVIIEASSRRGMIKALPKVYDGGHVALEQVHVLRGSIIKVSGSPSVPMGGDGEPLGMLPTSSQDPAILQVRPGALTILR